MALARVSSGPSDLRSRSSYSGRCGFEVGRQRLKFVYQDPEAFAQVNRAGWLGSLNSEAGFAKVAGLELTLLDCMVRSLQPR